MKTILVTTEDKTEVFWIIGTSEQILDYVLTQKVSIVNTAKIVNLAHSAEAPQEPQQPEQPQQTQQLQQPENFRWEAWQREQAAMIFAYRKMHSPKLSQKAFSDLLKEKFEIGICQTEISKVERGKRAFTKRQWKQIKTLFTL